MGIGEAIAKLFADHAASVVLLSRMPGAWKLPAIVWPH